MDSRLVGSFLRKRRISLRLTQRQVAEMLGFQTCQFISNIERGIADIPPSRIKDFAEVLQVNAQELAAMVSESMRTKLMKKTSIPLGQEAGSMGKEDDPFVNAFILAWQTADEEAKASIKYLAMKVLNMDYELAEAGEDRIRRAGRPPLSVNQ
ncbi:MAG: helix-turn-helix transcriptional regulator [Oligoflexia bacterium]|nr:helix-turn-helix transcriptional regulator [Oligoflexia bacterium]